MATKKTLSYVLVILRENADLSWFHRRKHAQNMCDAINDLACDGERRGVIRYFAHHHYRSPRLVYMARTIEVNPLMWT